VKSVDARILIATGLFIVGLSLMMQTGFDLDMGSREVVTSGLVQGFGVGLVFMPLNLLAFATLAPVLRTEGAAIYSLMRSIGGAIAISVTTALIASNVQTSHGDIGSNLTTITMPYVEAGLAERMGQSSSAILQFLDLEVNRQALMVAYLDDYWVMMWAAFAVIPLVLLLRRPPRGAAPPPPME
jgi:DHA2 family multidrug resistance protein